MQLHSTSSGKSPIFEPRWLEDRLPRSDPETIDARYSLVRQSGSDYLWESPWVDWGKYIRITRSYWKEAQRSYFRKHRTCQRTCISVPRPDCLGWADRIVSFVTWSYLTEERPTISNGKINANGLEPLQTKNRSSSRYFWTKNHSLRQEVTGAQ